MQLEELEKLLALMRREKVQSFQVEGDKVLVSFAPIAHTPPARPPKPLTEDEPDIDDPESDLFYSAPEPTGG